MGWIRQRSTHPIERPLNRTDIDPDDSKTAEKGSVARRAETRCLECRRAEGQYRRARLAVPAQSRAHAPMSPYRFASAATWSTLPSRRRFSGLASDLSGRAISPSSAGGSGAITGSRSDVAISLRIGRHLVHLTLAQEIQRPGIVQTVARGKKIADDRKRMQILLLQCGDP